MCLRIGELLQHVRQDVYEPLATRMIIEFIVHLHSHWIFQWSMWSDTGGLYIYIYIANKGWLYPTLVYQDMTRTKHIYYYLIYLRVLGLDKVQKFTGLCFVLGRYTSIGLTVYTVEKKPGVSSSYGKLRPSMAMKTPNIDRMEVGRLASDMFKSTVFVYYVRWKLVTCQPRRWQGRWPKSTSCSCVPSVSPEPEQSLGRSRISIVSNHSSSSPQCQSKIYTPRTTPVNQTFIRTKSAPIMGSQRVRRHFSQSTYLLQVVQGVNSPAATKEILLASISASLVFAGTLSRASAAELLRWGVPARFMPLMLGTGLLEAAVAKFQPEGSTFGGWNAKSKHLWEGLWPVTREEIVTFYMYSWFCCSRDLSDRRGFSNLPRFSN